MPILGLVCDLEGAPLLKRYVDADVRDRHYGYWSKHICNFTPCHVRRVKRKKKKLGCQMQGSLCVTA